MDARKSFVPLQYSMAYCFVSDVKIPVNNYFNKYNYSSVTCCTVRSTVAVYTGTRVIFAIFWHRRTCAIVFTGIRCTHAWKERCYTIKYNKVFPVDSKRFLGRGVHWWFASAPYVAWWEISTEHSSEGNGLLYRTVHILSSFMYEVPHCIVTEPNNGILKTRNFGFWFWVSPPLLLIQPHTQTISNSGK